MKSAAWLHLDQIVPLAVPCHHALKAAVHLLGKLFFSGNVPILLGDLEREAAV